LGQKAHNIGKGYVYLLRTDDTNDNMHPGNGGSLLLEIAVALSIIGLITGFFATKTITTNRAMRAQMMRNNMETIVAAMASFLANNNRLPMPAADASGREKNTNSLEDYAGLVPFGVLGLSEKDVIDGQGRPLIYVVEPFLTQRFNGIHRNDGECGGGIGQQDYFCNDIYAPRITLDQQTSPNNANTAVNVDIIAFALDTEDTKPAIVNNKFVLKRSANVKWITRDLLLVKYLKSCPCHRRAAQDTVSSTTAMEEAPEDDMDTLAGGGASDSDYEEMY
jgi:type II secretory pathway pseudopilin PulG